MRNVFIAVGGSGAKVAEALVRLLAAGFPTRKENGLYTSAGDTLQIWRVDPDINSGAAFALQRCVKDYEELQRQLADGAAVKPDLAASRWAMDVDTRIRHLDPLQLPRVAENDNEIKTLRGVLDSNYGSKKSSGPLLDPFYEEKDLSVVIDRGFYQKPFIGASVMAVFAASLNDENSPAGRTAGLTAFHNNEANFFLCGSLHGGTGASGVPVMGKYLASRKKANPHWGWRIGACLLTPYCVPPQPPFNALPEGEQPDEQAIDELLRKYADEPAFADLPPERKRELIKQILLGFYAEPEAMELRARQGLSYYKDHSADYFDELYLVGKPEPDKLKVWSNGGQSQSNPLNSAEVVSALAALNFFSTRSAGTPQSYMIGSATENLNSEKMSLGQLPKYSLGAAGDGAEVDPEKVLLATAIMHHLLLHQIRWEIPARSWAGIEGLRNLYSNNEGRKLEDQRHYSVAAGLIEKSIFSLIHPGHTLGWSGEDADRISKFFSAAPANVAEITGKLAKKFWGTEAKEALVLGRSAIKVSTVEFGKWSPVSDQFSRGEYLRHVWSRLFERAQELAAAEVGR